MTQRRRRPSRSRTTRLSPMPRLIAPAIEALESRTLLTAAAAGVLDPTFGIGGKAVDGVPSAFDDLHDARLQSDGRIVAISGTRLARYTANGAPDPTFGTGGATQIPRAVGAFAVRGDDKIVVAEYDPADANRIVLARYTASGQIDTTFGGGDGEVSQPYFGGATTTGKVVRKLLVEPGSNRMYLAGNATAETLDFALAAFNEDGSLYDQFGDTGQFTTLTDFGHADTLNDAAIAPNGDIVAVGSWVVSDSHHPFYAGDYAVVRWGQSGIPVPSFSGDGKTTVQFGIGQDPDSLFDTAQSVAFDGAGDIVVAGRSYDPQNTTTFFTSVARLTPDGTLDRTFGPGGTDGDGRVLLPLAAPNFYAVNSVAVLPTDELLLATAAAPSFSPVDRADFALARLNAAGAVDAFTTTTDFGANDYPSRLLLQSGKALVVGGSSDAEAPPAPNSTRLAMARYLLSSAYGGTPASLANPLQFENFDEGGEGVAYHDTDAVNQGGVYRNTGVDIQPIANAGGFNLGFAKAGEWTQYTVSVPESGDYDVDVRLASLKGGGKFHFELDGQPLGTTVTATNTGDWQKYVSLRVGPVSMSGGTHVLRLVMDGNDATGYVANFDSARFTRRAVVPAQTPFGGKAFTTPGRLQLENFDEGGEGVAYHDTDTVNQGGAYRNTGADVETIPGSSGGGYALDFAKAGEWTEYTFVVPPLQGATYDLALRYAAPRGGDLSIEIDGQPVGLPITLRNTASWQDYQEAFPAFDVTLAPGTHVLRLNQIRNGSYGYVANFDYLEFQRYRDPFFHTPFNPGETIQAEDFDIGGEGWTYHDTEAANVGTAAYRPAEGVDIEPTTDAGGGYNVGFTKAGEWIEYTVTNPGAEALFGIDVRLASLRAGSKFHFEVDRTTVASFSVPATASWQTYTTLSSAKTVRLTQGPHRLRLVMDQNNSTGYVANFNWMKIVP
jgi:uncharacterized delta-60 repeat protein